MKTIGLLGGMSWESTLGYYRAINEGIKKALGGLHSAKIVMFSVDFGPIFKGCQAARGFARAVDQCFLAKTKIAQCIEKGLRSDELTDLDRADVAGIFDNLLYRQPAARKCVMDRVFADRVFAVLAKENGVGGGLARL